MKIAERGESERGEERKGQAMGSEGIMQKYEKGNGLLGKGQESDEGIMGISPPLCSAYTVEERESGEC